MINNFSNRQAYGDIYTIPTSAVDNIAARLIQEQRQRELEKRQQDKALEDEFAKNVAGVKSADIPEITQAYNKFKQAHIELQRKGNKATPEDQMKVMLEKANAFSAINASKEDKEYLALRAKEGKNNKRYNPDYQIRINEKLNTPTSKRNRDLDDDDLLYKYAMPNIDKEIKAAVTPPMGKEVVEIDLGVDGSDPLKDKKKTYKVINPPNAVYNSLYHGIGSRADNDAFSQFMINSLNDDEKKKLRTDFEVKIASPEFKAVYGDVQPFPESASKTDLGEAVALKVMQSFVDLPLNGTEKSVLNADRNKDRALEDWKIKEAIKNREWDRRRPLRFADSMKLMLANKAAGQPSLDTGYLSDEVADEVGENQTVTLGGKQREVRVIYTDKVDPKRLAIINAKGQVKPIPIKVLDANTGKPTGEIKMGYYQDRTTGDWEGLDGQGNTRVISRERVKDDYIKEAAPTKFKNQTGTKASENTKGTKTTTKPKSDPLGLGF